MAGSVSSRKEAEAAIGDPEGLALLESLVAIAPTNLEDPAHDRFEKPNYSRGADEIVRWARRFGLATRRFDPTTDLPPDPSYRHVPRPNVVVDLELGAPDRILILAHYDVVPVPAEQRSHWKSPPHSVTLRSDGRLYGRGANDDLGSGVVSSLLALRRLADDGSPRNVRLLVCCDEETGGHGGIEAIKRHDDALPIQNPARILSGVAALIPDGSPHATAGSSGVVFLDAGFEGPARLDETLRYGRSLLDLHELARRWRSAYASPDWPEFGAPEAFLTGRATVTRFDVSEGRPTEGAVTLAAAHAENDAPNQIAEAVTLVFEGPSDRLERLADAIPSYVIPPFHSIRPARATALPVPPGALSVQIVGQSAHGGYPHRGHNPVPIALGVLERAVSDGLLNVGGGGASTFSVDLRLIPEMRLEQGRGEALRRVESFLRRELPRGRIDAPLARARGGYSLPTDHPAVGKLERLVRSEFGVGGIFGEYGGTDASSLVGVSTPAGEPIPALVFGSIDRSARIHEAEESVDPISIGRVSRIIERFVREP